MFKKLRENADKITSTVKSTANTVADKVGEVIPDDVVDGVNKVKGGIGNTITDISNKAGDYLDSNLDGIESYCSWCFKINGCTPKEKNNFSRNIYACNSCGKEVVKCRACNNKAKFSGDENTIAVEQNVSEQVVGMWAENFCSVHEGTIAKFETLNWKLDAITEYRDIVERDEKNYKKIGTTAAFTIGGVAVIAPLALVAAPAVGGAIGTSILGYSGAAATNAGLATLGGGAIAAGGAGMAGGVAVVTAAGSALGGRYGAVISNSYYGDIDGFDIIKIQQGKKPSIICIDGFLNEKVKEAPGKWLEDLSEIYPENEILYVKWESKRLQDIASSASGLGVGEIAKKGLWSMAKSASKVAATKIAPVGVAFQALGLATNPWSVAGVKAYQTGVLLADIIARTEKEYILIGHSLGARVIYSCLASLKTKDETFIKDVHLLGGAVNNICSSAKEPSNAVNWSSIDNAVSGEIHNYFSLNDSVLKYLYKLGEGVKFDIGNPIGRNKIENPKIKNHDVSNYVTGHTKYKEELKNFFS